MGYWLLKSEPDTFSIEHLKGQPRKITSWDGIRNYQARNMMRDNMRKGDLAFFYHSSCAVPGIVGIVEVVKEAYPDFTALDPSSPYFDSKASVENPRWCMVDVQFKQQFAQMISLKALKQMPVLAEMPLLKKGNRLSIMPITDSQWRHILSVAD